MSLTHRTISHSNLSRHNSPEPGSSGDSNQDHVGSSTIVLVGRSTKGSTGLVNSNNKPSCTEYVENERRDGEWEQGMKRPSREVVRRHDLDPN